MPAIFDFAHIMSRQSYLITVFTLSCCCAGLSLSISLQHTRNTQTRNKRVDSLRECLNLNFIPPKSFLVKKAEEKIGGSACNPTQSSTSIQNTCFRLGYTLQTRARRGHLYQSESDSTNGRDPSLFQDVCSVPDGLTQAAP